MDNTYVEFSNKYILDVVSKGYDQLNILKHLKDKDVYIYSRATTQINENAQFSRLKTFAETNGLNVVGDVREKCSSDSFGRAYEELKKKIEKDSILLIYSSCRIHRDSAELSKEMEYFFNNGITVITIDPIYINLDYQTAIFVKRESQKRYCVRTSAPLFAPPSGVCYNCNKQIYNQIGFKNASETLITGCPFCNRSFCD